MNTSKFARYFTVILFFFCTSCNPFDFSPYDSPYLADGKEDLNAKNIEKISKIEKADTNYFCFAIISDSHIDYSTLEEAVTHINNDKEILFVIHLGDMTDCGLSKEYQWTNEKMLKLNIPYIMVIGNHDYRSNGKLIYNEKYGPSSFTFTFNKTKFVCFDDVVWENNNTYPDFEWLEKSLSDNDRYNQTFVFSHIPPFSDQFDTYCESTYNKIITSHNIALSAHGHNHNYSLDQHYNKGNEWYLVSSYITNRIYHKVYVSNSTFKIENVSF